MTLNEFTTVTNIKTEITDSYGFTYRPVIICNDGFLMSVQGSKGHYSQPRSVSDIFEEMEIGFLSQDEPLIFEYAETENDWTNTVYPYVPVEIIQQVIDKHNGINVEETFDK